jgi:pyruvate dehydrogenase (quinone)
MGGCGLTVDDPAQLDRVMDQAMAAEGPVIIQAIVDQNEPLLPAVVSKSYAQHLAKALDEGTKGATEIRQALEREPSRSMMGG